MQWYCITIAWATQDISCIYITLGLRHVKCSRVGKCWIQHAILAHSTWILYPNIYPKYRVSLSLSLVLWVMGSVVLPNPHPSRTQVKRNTSGNNLTGNGIDLCVVIYMKTCILVFQIYKYCLWKVASCKNLHIMIFCILLNGLLISTEASYFMFDILLEPLGWIQVVKANMRLYFVQCSKNR